MKIKKGDSVVVIAGKEKTKTGIIKEVNLSKNTVIVEGLNLRKHHVKPTQQNPEGGIIDLEGPIHISNVMLNIGDKNKTVASKIKYKIIKNKNGKKEKKRVAKRNGETI